MEEKELLAGTIVHIYGFPVELAQHVKVLTFTGNWPLIEQAKRAHGDAISSASGVSSPSHQPDGL